MYHPTTRVLTVLELLQVHQRLTGPDLAARLEVDLRTVRRYITMLQDLGIPVEGERGRYGGYRLRPGYKLPPLMLTDDEALAVTLGLMTARRLGIAAAGPAVEGALAKVERVLPPSVRQRVTAVQETLSLDLRGRPGAPDTTTLITLSLAAQERRRVRLRYASAREEVTERAVDPYGLVYLNGRWYAAAYCHLRADLRVFRLDRIQGIAPDEERFERPVNFDVLAFVRHSLAQMPGAWRVEVLLQTTLDEARQWIPPQAATLEATAGGVLLRDFADDLDWMARQLVALGCPFVVREPVELSVALRRLGERLLDIADLGKPDGDHNF